MLFLQDSSNSSGETADVTFLDSRCWKNAARMMSRGATTGEGEECSVHRWVWASHLTSETQGLGLLWCKP